jgi:hypothetical protein
MPRYKLSPRKLQFSRYYFNFERKYSSCLSGNAYRCALKANYSETYAKRIMSYIRWEELATLAEKQGVIMDEGLKKYLDKISENVSKC